MELRKCNECKMVMSLDNFRKSCLACKRCNQLLQNKNRRERRKTMGMRQDPTRSIRDIEVEAMKALYGAGWKQSDIAEAFNINQTTVSANVAP